MHMLVVVFTMFMGVSRDPGPARREVSISRKLVTLLGILGVSGVVCVCARVCMCVCV